MSDQLDEMQNDAGLTKPKKNRSEAQKAATERMRKALESKQLSSGGLSTDEKKLRLQAIKEQLNGPPKKNMDKAPLTKVETKKEAIPESEVESEEEAPPPPAPKKKEKKILSQPKKEPKVVYESASESEEEVIVIKKKKKPKKKTIIYEDATEYNWSNRIFEFLEHLWVRIGSCPLWDIVHRDPDRLTRSKEEVTVRQNIGARFVLAKEGIGHLGWWRKVCQATRRGRCVEHRLGLHGRGHRNDNA
jgi:hypothetical protein